MHGAVKWLHVRSTADRDASGDVFRLTGMIQDVTSRRQLEEQVQHAQKMEAVGQLAGGVAHDFNNLLTVINCTVESMLAETHEPSSRRDELVEIRHAATRAGELTHQLPAFSRKQVLAPRIVDLNEAVSQRDRTLRRLIGEDIRIVTLISAESPRVSADPGQLEQVLINLAVNARDAMPTGGSLTIATRDLEVAPPGVADPHTGRYVELSVSDTGRGFSDEVRSHLFEPFFTTKHVGRGTGLGLATVYGIVKQSGGHITVESQVGVGTTFRVLLPVAAGNSGSTAGSPTPLAPGGTETILLVEDEDALRKATRRVLEKQGYTVYEADGSTAALEFAKHKLECLDLVITDVVMPVLSGRQVADQLRRARPDLQILFISGYTDDAVVRHGVLVGTDHFLQKPFTPATLAAKVRSVLRQEPSLRQPGAE